MQGSLIIAQGLALSVIKLSWGKVAWVGNVTRLWSQTEHHHCNGTRAIFNSSRLAGTYRCGQDGHDGVVR